MTRVTTSTYIHYYLPRVGHKQLVLGLVKGLLKPHLESGKWAGVCAPKGTHRKQWDQKHPQSHPSTWVFLLSYGVYAPRYYYSSIKQQGNA